MSRLGSKCLVYHGDLCLGELDVIPVKDNPNIQFPNNEIRIHRISPQSERCPPLSVFQTISSYSVCCKLQSSSPVEQPYLTNLYTSCQIQSKTAVVLMGEREIHLVAMMSKYKKFPRFWCYSVPKGLYDTTLGMLNMRRLAIVFDLDETLIVANSMRSFEDKMEILQGCIARETDPLKLAERRVELKRYEGDRLILKQYADSDTVVDNGKVFIAQMEEVASLCDDHGRKLVRPVIRLQDKNIVLTRINPEIRDTSVLVRLRPAWENMRSYLTTNGRKRFDVFVCTMAERDYALEMWRLLDPDACLISPKQLLDRVVCVNSGSKKSLITVFQNGICHSKMAMVIDDRLNVWEDEDQPQVHEVPAFSPYADPHAETANNLPVLRLARDVAWDVRVYFFKEFDANVLLGRFSDIYYEDDVVNLPPSPNISNYLTLVSEKLSPLDSRSLILNQNKLTNQYYIDWKHNLFKVLDAENYKFVLTQRCPQKPALGVARNVRMPYVKWQKANEMAKYYIMASISNDLQNKHQNMATAAEIMNSLDKMFSQRKSQEGPSSLFEHNHLNEWKVQGAKIDEVTKIGPLMLLEALKQYKVNLNMNEKKFTEKESVNKQEGLVDMTKLNPSKPKIKELSKKNKNKKKKKIGLRKPSTKKDGKPNGKCFNCGEKGHWRKDCLKLTK